MEVSQIVLQQTVVMFLYMLAGFTLFKTGKITSQGSRDIAALLLHLVIPAVIVNSFCVERTAERWKALGVSSLVGALALALALAVSRTIFRASPIDDFAAAFSNAGFMGIPLVQAALGPDAVFYLVAFVALLNVLQWTYGVAVMTGQSTAVSPKAVIRNPIMAGLLIGLLLFAAGLGTGLPNVVSVTVKGVAALNAPLAMLVLGVYLAQTDLKSLVTTPRLYWTSAVRLVVIPLLTGLVLFVLPIPRDVKLALLIAAAAPVGANVAVYAQIHGLDHPYACQTVALSTILSVGTLPALVSIAAKFF